MQKFTFIRNISFFLFFSLLIGIKSGHAQDIIAKIKYEEAEAAFEKEDFQTAISKIDEVEVILKRTSPKTLYLKIVSEFKISEPSYRLIENLKYNCNYYLKYYSQIEGIEEKYREVYKISESIKNYPKTEFEYNEWISARRKESSEIQAEKKKNFQSQEIAAKLSSWNTSIEGIRLDMNFSELPSSTWNYLDRSYGMTYEKGNFFGLTLNRKSIAYSPKYNSFKFKSQVGLYGLWIDAETKKVLSVTKNHYVGGKSDIEYAKSHYETLAQKLRTQFGMENVLETDSTIQTGKNSSSYTKTISLPQNSPISISYTLNIIIYGGMLGTQVSVSETLSAPNFLVK